MGRKLGCVLALLALVIPASASLKTGTISGVVRNTAGVPQMGAAVEILAPSLRAITVFTDANGFYKAGDLTPGTYDVKVSAASFLPSLREDVNVRAGATLIVNLTLNTLFEAMQLLPARRTSAGPDDWNWTLRSVANRPILRVLDDGPLVVTSQKGGHENKALKARVAFMAGSQAEGFGSPGDMTTGFTLERSIFSSGTLSVGGNLGYGTGPQGVVRAAYTHHMENGSLPEVAVTVRRFATPDSVAHNAALEAMALSFSDTFNFGEFLELNLGSEFQSVQFTGHVTAWRPFGTVSAHLSPDTVVQYQYATSEPTTRAAKGYDSAPADLTESTPRVSLVDSRTVLQKARHQEVSLSHRIGDNRFQVAVYHDRIRDSALTGAGDVVEDFGDILPDIYSGTFTYNAGNLKTNGLRLVAERKVSPLLTATMSYSYGGVLSLDSVEREWGKLSFRPARRHAVTGKLSGLVPRAQTRWMASYKWTSGDALSPVDLFNSSPGQSDPFLNVFVRQPLPSTILLPGRFEALVDLRNLLAQGYVPVVGPDGRTLYLVQSARSVRGGVAFVF